MTRDAKAPIFARIPPPVWAAIYVMAAWGLSTLTGLSPLAPLHQPGLSWALILGGVALAVSGAYSFRSAGAEIDPASEANRLLITRGPYRFTRNPMYLGLTLVTLGIAFLTGIMSFFAVPAFVLVTNDQTTIPYEEAKMERQFGEAYRVYKKSVRRWI